MNKIYQKKKVLEKNRSKAGFDGFTLIELLVVVLIIGVLTAVAISKYDKAVEKTRAGRITILVRAIADAEERYFMANGEYAADIGKLDISFPGTPATYYVPGFETEDFICRPTRPAEGSIWGEFLAVCSRFPREQYYLIGKLKDGRMVCRAYSNKGKTICAMFGKLNADGLYEF